jgi:GntR family transcriptional regulator/MocR family aminotransferase
VQAEPDDVIVTQGAQQAFDLVARVLISGGTAVAVEDPGYTRARLLFRSHGARVVPVPVDHEGVVVSRIPPKVELIYVTPSHQFPLGHVMSFQRRTELLAWAERTGALIIEDDYDSEFRFGGRPLDPLQSLDRSGCVIYVGTLSKVMLPTLRLGFLVAPASLRASLLKAKQLTDWHSDSAKQSASARFIRQGLLAKHIRRLNHIYTERYQLIASLIGTKLQRWLRLLPSAGGIHLSVEFARSGNRRIDANKVVAAADARGVKINSIAEYYFRPADALSNPGLVLGFGAIPTHLIEEGLARLAVSCAEA